MPNTKAKNLVIALLLVVSIICFTFGALAVSDENLTGTVMSEETHSDSQELQVILNMKSAMCIPDAIVSARENNMASNATAVQEPSRRNTNKQSVIFVLLMLFLYAPALVLLRFQQSITKTITANMPILSLSLGGNSPPVIRA